MEKAKHIYNPNNSKGFTLVELLIAVTMFSFVLLLIATVFIQINRTYTRGVNMKAVHEETRGVLDSVSRDFRTVSSSQQVKVDCADPACADDVATEKLCIDDNAYIFKAPDPDADEEGELRLAENVNCSSASITSGTELFSGQVQPQFFKVNEIVAGKTYQVEMVVSTGSFSSDLLVDTGGSDDPRDIGCDPSLPGNQFCRAVYLDTIVTLRNR